MILLPNILKLIPYPELEKTSFPGPGQLLVDERQATTPFVHIGR